MNISQAVQSLVGTRSMQRGEMRAPVVGTDVTSRVVGINNTQVPEWSAEVAVRHAYLVNWAVYRCASIIADDLVAMAIRAGLDASKPNKYNVNAKLAQLLGPPPGGPAPDIAPAQFLRWLFVQYIVTGRMGAEIEWSGKPSQSQVVALWPLVAEYLKPQIRVEDPATGNEVKPPTPRYFHGFEYRTRATVGKFLRYDQVFYHWRPSQVDWREPESVLQAVQPDIAAMVDQSLLDLSLLRNGNVPAALVVVQKFESDKAYRDFERRWSSKYQGPRNAGKTAIVEMDSDDGNVGQMVDVKVLGASAKDALADKRFEQRVDSICSAMGVPRSRFDASNRTFSNGGIEQENYEQSTLIPYAVDFEQAFNIRLAPLLGREVCWFDRSGLVTQRKTQNFAQVSAIDAWKGDGLTYNEYRDALGMPGITDPEGEMFFTEWSKKNAPEPPPAPTPIPVPQPAELPASTNQDPNSSTPSESALTPASGTPGGATKGKEPHAPALSVDLPSSTPYPALSQRSGADVADGIMVAFMLDPKTAQTLAVDGGEAPDIMHCTLVYPGKTSDGFDRQALTSAVRDFAKTQPPIAGKVTGKGVFDTADGCAVVALVNCAGLGELRYSLVTAIEAAGIQFPDTYDFIPHITIAYVADREAAASIDVPANVPLTFHSLTVAWGGEKTSFPMGGRRGLPNLDIRGSDDSTARRAGMWRAIDIQMQAFEKHWELTFQRLFARQKRQTLARLEGKPGRSLVRTTDDPNQDVSLIFDPAFWQQETSDASQGLYRTLFIYAAGKAIEKFGGSFDLQSPFVEQFIQSRANTLAGQVTDTTYNQIKDQMAEGTRNGESIEKLATRIQSVFDQADRTRATLIAVTEVVSAHNGSTNLAGEQYGTDVVAGKEWLSTHDDRVRRTHRDADGQVREMGERFEVGGSHLAFPGDPSGSPDEVCRCRCVELLLSPNEMLAHRSKQHYRRVEEVEAELMRMAVSQ